VEISILQWKDSKAVCCASNFHGSETTTVSRKQKDGSNVFGSCPVVFDYNKHMGEVNRGDHLQAVYRLDHSSKKWRQRLFWGILEMTFINAYVIDCQQFQRIPLLEFRRQVSQGLMIQTELPITNKSPQMWNSEAKCSNPTKWRKSEDSATILSPL
jgi:hypothetical protein